MIPIIGGSGNLPRAGGGGIESSTGYYELPEASPLPSQATITSYSWLQSCVLKVLGHFSNFSSVPSHVTLVKIIGWSFAPQKFFF